MYCPRWFWGICIASISCFVAFPIVHKAFYVWNNRTNFRFKVVSAFSFFVIFPCLIMAVFSVLFLEMGLHSWFHQRVKTALTESQQIAQAYLTEHKKVMENTVMAMAKGLDSFFNMISHNQRLLLPDPELFFEASEKDLNEYLSVHEAFRSVKEAIIFLMPKETVSSFACCHAPSKVIAHSRFSFSLSLKLLSPQDLQKAKKDGISISINESGNQVLAIVPIFYPLNAFLLISRDIDQNILQKIHSTNEAAGSYDDLFHKQRTLAFQFSIVFVLFTLLLLGLAIWGGLFFARHMTDPVSALIDAAQLIKQGEMKIVQCKGMLIVKELQTLMTTFNDMIQEMTQQKQELIDANQHLNERTQLIESVISGVSSGVMSLTQTGKIILCNGRAQSLLAQKKSLEGRFLKDVIEEFELSFTKALSHPGKSQSNQLKVVRLGKPLIFRVQIMAYAEAKEVILTFDDITELIAAQKKTAWEDVARRIAHEVKNPLTPIMLSAERLRRRYLPTIQHDASVFRDCIETIIRQVSHIGKLITEFSTFARMPTPLLKDVDLDALIHQLITLQQQAYPSIRFLYERKSLSLLCDGPQIEQVLMNIVKNSVESILDKKSQKGMVRVIVRQTKNLMTLHILDNGIGLSHNHFHQPHTSTKPQGMGLGLLIVEKIISDHGGKFSLLQRPQIRGAHAVITFVKALPALIRAS